MPFSNRTKIMVLGRRLIDDHAGCIQVKNSDADMLVGLG